MKRKKRPLAPCRLCGDTKLLCWSHFIPSGLIYQLGNASGLSNSEPVWLTKDLILQSCRPICDYLLCEDCEDRFSKNGETWVVDNVYQEGGGFPILEALKKAVPWGFAGQSAFYAGAEILEI